MTTTATYDIGDRRKLSAQIRNEAGALADPTDLTFYMKEPDGTVTDYLYGTDSEVIKDGVGAYSVYWDCAIAGWHHWRFEATGSVVVAEEAVFRVRRSRVLPEDSGS